MKLRLPPAHDKLFFGGIVHPDLYLWDSWSYQEGDETHLYCLALNRFDNEGNRIAPSDRNDYPFHIRHFMSLDGGTSWSDLGSFMQPRFTQGLYDSKSVWSGSVTLLEDGRKLAAYTGLREAGSELQYQQSMAVTLTHDGHVLETPPTEALSCALRDHAEILDQGYFLAELDFLGHKNGEAQGPILAWRDPFIIEHDGQLHMFWCAKTDTNTGALAHGLLAEGAAGFYLSHLFEPILVPDCEEFTQLELPKVLYDEVHELFYLVIATSNQQYEGQPAEEVIRDVRLYRSSSIRGEWEPARDKGSIILAADSFMYGITVLETDFNQGTLTCIAPLTETAPNGKALSLSEVFTLSIHD